MTPEELMNIRDALYVYKTYVPEGKHYDRLVECIRVVQREINLQTTDYVRGTTIPIFKNRLHLGNETIPPTECPSCGQSLDLPNCNIDHLKFKKDFEIRKNTPVYGNTSEY